MILSNAAVNCDFMTSALLIKYIADIEGVIKLGLLI